MGHSLVNALPKPASETDRARQALENVLTATEKADAAMELINSGSDEHTVMSMVSDYPDKDEEREALRSLAGYADRARRALAVLADDSVDGARPGRRRGFNPKKRKR